MTSRDQSRTPSRPRCRGLLRRRPPFGRPQRRVWTLDPSSPIESHATSRGFREHSFLHVDRWLDRCLSSEAWEGVLLYSDQPPGGPPDPPGSVGHAKGVVLWNRETVGWLVHSMPRWPEAIGLGAAHSVPLVEHSQLLLGQSMLWAALPAAHLSGVLHQVRVMQSFVYHYRTSSGGRDVWPEGAGAAARPPPSAANPSIVQLGPNLWHLAKGASWGGDLYGDCLAKRFGGRWLAETHMKTAEDNKLPPTQAVGNVTRIVFPDGKDYGSKGDHSKWAVARPGGPGGFMPSVLVGDLNRCDSQRRRGGGGLLLAEPALHRAFLELVKETDTDF